MFDGPCGLSLIWRAARVSLPVRCDSFPFLRVSQAGPFLYRRADALPLAQIALRQEWSETNVRERWVSSRSNVVTSSVEGILNVLREPKVGELIVGIVQARAVVNLEERCVSELNSETSEYECFKCIGVGIGRTE